MKETIENNSNRNFAKEILTEVFIGKLSEIREHFSRKYCKINGIDEDKWNYIAPSSMDGLKVRNIHNGFEFTFWAGGSGTNNMAIDNYGGCHDLSFHKNYDFEVVL